MTITFIGATAGNSGTGTATTFDTSFHASAEAGDVMVIACHVSGNSVTATSIEHVDGEADDWTSVAGITFPVDQSTNSRIVGAWWRRLTQADIDNDLAPTITLSGAATAGWTSLTMRGARRDSTVIGQVNSAVANTTSVTLGTLTGVTVDSALLAFGHGRVPTGTSALTGWAPDADYTEPAGADHGTNRTSGSNPNIRMFAAYRLGVAQGNYSGDVFTPNATASLGTIVLELTCEPTPSTTIIMDAQVTPFVELRTGPGRSWVQADVRYGGPGGRAIVIDKERSNEQSTFSHSTCTVKFDNRTGNYSPLNPLSSNYGKLGRNTPLRVGRLIASHAFSGSTSNGLGTADTGHEWVVQGAVAPYSVGSGVATLATTATGTVYQAILGGVSLDRGLVRARIAVGVVAATASVQAAIGVHWQDTGNYYFGVIIYQTGGTIDLAIIKRTDGTNDQISAIGEGLPYDANTEFDVELGYEGGAFSMHVWDVADPTSHASTYGFDGANVPAVGAFSSVSLRAFRSTGNTNGTVNVTFDNLRLDSPRFVGEVPDWPPAWDLTGSDGTVTVTAQGITGRIGAGRQAIRSALFRYLEDRAADTGDGLVAAWPLEDGPLAEIGEPLVGTYAMQPFVGTHPSGAVTTYPQFGSGTLAPWLPPVLSWAGASGLSIMYAAVFMPTFTTEYTIEFAVAIATDSPDFFVDVNPSYLGGSTGWPQLVLSPAGREVIFSANGEPDSSTVVASLFDGKVHYIRISIEDAAGDLAWAVEVDGVLGEFGQTAGAMTVEAPEYVAFGSEASEGKTPVAAGYLSVWVDEPTFNPALSQGAGLGYVGETVIERLDRLCGEESYLLVMRSTVDDTEGMGPQGLHPLGTTIDETEGVNRGGLFEPTALYPAIGYRTRTEMQNQPIRLDMDYSAHHLSAVPAISSDLSLVVNDVTASKTDGGSRRHVVTSGPLSTQEHPDGIGVYDKAITANVQDEDFLERIAEWVAGLGTAEAPRVPGLRVALHRTDFATLINDALAVQFGSRLRVSDLPSLFFAPGPITGLVYGWQEEWDQFETYLTYNVIPDEVQSSIGIWSDDDSRWDSDVSSVNTSFDAGTDTSLSVAIEAGGSLWVTTAVDSTQFPFNIVASGVELEVTGIAGTSSPQTFTVTQAPVNGIEKTIAVGEKVSLADPVYWS